ncbi:MAG: hypothetical protein M1819_000940 [Sarea resinae]|nr:MAG: hypothetical protein M1819_000940 [Sarea resinae]
MLHSRLPGLWPLKPPKPGAPEPFNIIESLTAISETCKSIASLCSVYGDYTDNAAVDRLALASSTYRNDADHLVGYLRKNPARLLSIRPLSNRDGPAEEALEKLEGIKRKLETGVGANNGEDYELLLQWPFAERDLDNQLAGLNPFKSMMILISKADEMHVNLAIRQENSDYWFDAPDYQAFHRSLREERVLGTGESLLSDGLYARWKKETSSLMWLFGNPGSGKTFMCSSLVDALLHDQEVGEACAIAYFYLDSTISTDQRYYSYEGFIRTIVRQMRYQSKKAAAILEGHCDDTQTQSRARGPTPTSKQDLKIVFLKLVKAFESIYIVVDGVDTCDEQNEIISNISDMFALGIHSLHFLISCRDQSLTPRLQAGNTHQINLDHMNISKDIESYVRSNLERNDKFRGIASDLKEEMAKALLAESHGRFQWVDCQLFDLGENTQANEIKRALRAMPKTLDATYSRVISNLNPKYRRDAIRLLQWLFAARRVLRLSEMVEALTVDSEDCSRLGRDDRQLYCMEVISQCSTLVDISMVCHYPSDLEIRLGHSSVRDFLSSGEASEGSVLSSMFDPGIANDAVTRACIHYLLRLEEDDIANMTKEDLELKYPLTGYAMTYWTHHARRAVPSDALWQLCLELLKPDTPQYELWASNFDKSMPRHLVIYREGKTPPSHPLYYLSFAGLDDLGAKFLLDKRIKEDAILLFHSLIAASYPGQTSGPRQLLEHGAQPNFPPGLQSGHNSSSALSITPLDMAVSRDNLNVARLLFDYGAHHGGNKGSFHELELFVASQRGSVEIVNLLLERGAPVDALSGRPLAQAIFQAAANGHETVVKSLVSAGAKVGAEVIKEASRRGFESIARYLISQGGKNDLASLSSAAYLGLEDVLKAMLAERSDEDSKEWQERGPLASAASAGRDSIVKWLIEAGANVNPSIICGVKGSGDDYYMISAQGQRIERWGYFKNTVSTPLQAAALAGHVTTVRLLLSKGANINTQGGWFGNALQAAAYAGHLPVVTELLDHGADIDAEGGEYGCALVASVKRGHLDVMRELLDRKCNPDIQVQLIGCALTDAVDRGQREAVLELLKHGANPNVDRDDDLDGCAPLVKAVMKLRVQLVKDLLEAGADPNKKDLMWGLPKTYKTAFQAACSQTFECIGACSSGCFLHDTTEQEEEDIDLESNDQAIEQRFNEILGLLIDAGADVNLDGLPLRDAIIPENNTYTICLLLEHGADLNKRFKLEYEHSVNVSGDVTPLQWAAMQDHYSAIEILVQHGADPMVCTESGETLLHMVFYSKYCRANICKRLMDELGISPHTAASNGDLPLHMASAHYREDSVKLFLERGSDVNAANNAGQTPLHLAVSVPYPGNPSLIKLLLQHGADANARDGKGLTPLMAAEARLALYRSSPEAHIEQFIEALEALIEVLKVEYECKARDEEMVL